MILNLALSLALAFAAPQDTLPQDSLPRDASGEVATLRSKHGVPALAAAYWKDGALVAFGVDGVRERGSEVEVTAADRFHLGSCTKSMTATLIAMFVEDGTLRWDSTVGEVFEDLAEDLDPAWLDVTLTQLLTHRAGAPGDLRGYADGLGLVILGSKQPPPAMRLVLLEGVCAVPPKHAPGTTYEYSNNGYMIAAAMLERATGETWEHLIQTRLFDPLGMTTAGFGAPSSKDELDQPRGHWANGKSAKRFDNPACYGPAGTVHASLEDWLKYLQLHLAGARGEPTDLLGPESFARLHEPVGSNPEYAMGWIVTERPWAGGRALTHAGSNTAWYCTVWIAPAANLIILAASNQGGDAAAKATDQAVQILMLNSAALEYSKAKQAERARED